MSRTAIGVFNQQVEARQVADDLVGHGFAAGGIRILACDGNAELFNCGGRPEALDASGTGELTDALIHEGVPEETAQRYAREILHGATLVAVDVPRDEDLPSALDVLKRHDKGNVNQQDAEMAAREAEREPGRRILEETPGPDPAECAAGDLSMPVIRDDSD